ncbi:MAG: hypothetical protein ABW278_00925 [Steroidobacteraceae bacterium]
MESESTLLGAFGVAADYLGPAVAAIFGIWILRITKKLESAQWKSQKLVEKRIEVWDRLGPPVNDIYCYCLRVGTWKAHSPHAIVAKKRRADKLAYLSRPYFSDEFFADYTAFMDSCFQTFQDHGTDARIRTEAWEHQNVHADWTSDWTDLISEEPFDAPRIASAYKTLLAAVRRYINQVGDGAA